MEIITIITLIINIVVLAIVGFQTYYTKKSFNSTKESLKVAKESIELSRIYRQLEQLPEKNAVIHVKNCLERWNDEIKQTIKYLEDEDKEKIIKLSEKKLIVKKELLDYYSYTEMKKWLAIIYATGVQYYYTSSCNYPYLYNKETEKIEYEHYLQRFKESNYYLEILLKYIDEQIPKVFLKCPAKYNTVDFLKQ